MDIFLLPSYFEGLGISVIEAQAAGLTCFVSDTVSKDAHITRDIYYLSLRDNAYKWAKQILEIYGENKTRKDTYKEIIASGFDISNTSKFLEDFYFNLIK